MTPREFWYHVEARVQNDEAHRRELAWVVANIINTCGHVDDTITVDDLLHTAQTRKAPTKRAVDREREALRKQFPGMFPAREASDGNDS